MSFDEEIERMERKKLDEMLRRSLSEANPKPAGGLTAGVEVLSDVTFAQAVGKHPLTVVDFWAPWCGPCRIISPVIEELAKQYSGKVAFGKVNVDENLALSSSFGIEGIPTIMLFSRGRPIDAIVGAVPKAIIESKIRTHLGRASSVYA